MGQLEQCDCQKLADAVSDCVITKYSYAKGTRNVTVYALNHPSGEEGDGLFILFCPFCGRLAGDGLAMRQELWANN